MRKRTGTVQEVKGKFYFLIRFPPKQRECIPMPLCSTRAQADARAAIIADVSTALIDIGRGDRVKDIGMQLGAARSQKEIEGLRRTAVALGALDARDPNELTVKQFGEQWTSGALAARHPQYIKKKKSASQDEGMLRNWVYDHVGGVHLSEFTLDDGLRVLSHVPADSSRALHRHVAQVLVRLFTLAAFPCRLIEVSPLPRKFLPSLGDPKEKPFLYPREDAQLLACTEVPLEWRVFFALCAREGFRSSELAGGVIDKRKVEALTWAALDEVHGAISLDDTKTGAARTWAADDGVIRALNLWKMICGHKKPTDPIVNVPFGNRATLLRAYLARAKVERPELTHRSATRARIKAHSLRGTFITLSLANGKTETWVQDRTGHTSTIMINRYRRAARTAAELGLGPLTPMDLAIPELAAVVGQTENQGDATAKGQEHKSNDGQTRQGAADTSKETHP